MGTRGAYGFRVEGVDKLTYNHWDSYPSGLGLKMVDALKGVTDEALLRTAVNLHMVTVDSAPDAETIERYRGVSLDTGVGEGREDSWYCLLRGFQGEPEYMLSGTQGHAIDSASFLADSLFCEWAYIVNMDTRQLEVYKGFNKNPKAPGRYASLVEQVDHRAPEYHGVVLVSLIPLDQIRAGKGRSTMEAVEAAVYAEAD
jgi:hypothetical protein